MTISSNNRKAGPYVGNGTASVFPFAFKIFQASDLEVVRLTVATNVETLFDLTTDYTVTLNADQDSNPGGSITLVAGALATGYNLVITSDIENLQPTDLTNQGGFYPDVINDALDRATIQIQQLQEQTDRAIKVPITNPTSIAELTADLIRLADSADNIDTVANNIVDVNTTADNIADVNTVAGSIANVNTVAIDIAAVTTVANDLNEPVSEIETVANSIANVNTVGNNITNVNTTAANIANVNAVGSDLLEPVSEINTVAVNIANVNTVGTNIADVNTVATNITDVVAVGDNIADVVIAADNVADITNFADVYQGGKAADPTLRNNGSALQIGDMYFNTTVNELRIYSGTSWIAGTAGTLAVQRFSGTGAATVFTLATAPSGENNTQVYINGVYQQKDTYGVTGTTLTFSAAPPAGTDNIEVVTISTLALGETTASLVSVTDSGNYYTSGNVEGALQEAAQATTTKFLQAGTGAVNRSVQSKIREFVSVLDFGADLTGTTSSTTAFQNAIDSLPAKGGTVYIPAGTYIVGTLNFPNDPKTVNLVGESMNGTILQMETAVGPMIRKVQTSGRIDGAIMSDFTIRANASSDKTNLTHKAMVLSGWNNSFFKRIAYKSFTTSSGSVGKFIDLAASPYLSYQNVFEGIKCEVNYGPSQIISLNNNGAGVGSNPNIVEIRDSWFYACSGVNTIINAADCTRVTIRDCEFEDCPGAAGVVMGQNTLVESCWFELLGSNISTNSAASTDGSGSIVLNNYFSGAGTNFIDTIGVKPLWIGNAGGGQTITGQGVIKIEALGGSPAAPTLSGGDGTLTEVSRTTPVPLDTSGRVTYNLYYTVTPASTGFKKFTVSAISGYTIEIMSVASIRGANGDPKACGVDDTGTSFWVAYTSTDSHSITLRATYKKTGSF